MNHGSRRGRTPAWTWRHHGHAGLQGRLAVTRGLRPHRPRIWRRRGPAAGPAAELVQLGCREALLGPGSTEGPGLGVRAEVKGEGWPPLPSQPWAPGARPARGHLCRHLASPPHSALWCSLRGTGESAAGLSCKLVVTEQLNLVSSDPPRTREGSVLDSGFRAPPHGVCPGVTDSPHPHTSPFPERMRL